MPAPNALDGIYLRGYDFFGRVAQGKQEHLYDKKISQGITMRIFGLLTLSVCLIMGVSCTERQVADKMLKTESTAVAQESPEVPPVDLSRHTADQLFQILQSKESQWYEREACSAEMTKRPPEQVLGRLLSIMCAPSPEPLLLPAQGPCSFREAMEFPWPYPMRYAAGEAWNHIAWEPHSRETGQVLLKLLEQGLPQGQRSYVLGAFTRHFIPEAEPVLLEIVESDSSTEDEYLFSARALLDHRQDQYYERLVQLAMNPDYRARGALFKMLSSKMIKRKEPDERVIRLGFECLSKSLADDPSMPRKVAYLLTDIENYVGVKFLPYGNKERYRIGDRGYVTEAYFQKGVDNAMRWWKRWESKTVKTPHR